MDRRNDALGAAYPQHTVLFVDQDGLLRRTVERGLRRRGYRVLVADGAAIAIEVLLKSPVEIQVVISNVVIPRVGSCMRYIFTSARLTDTVLAMVRSRPGTAFLPKPWSIGELDRGVRELLSLPV